MNIIGNDSLIHKMGGENLPLEIQEKILSYMEDPALSSIAAVSRSWRQAALNVTKRREWTGLKKIVSHLTQPRKEYARYSVCANTFNAVSQEMQTLDDKIASLSLYDFKKPVHLWLKKTLMTLSGLLLNSLESIHKSYREENLPPTFEKIFRLAKKYTQMYPFKEFGDENRVDLEVLDGWVMDLISLGYFGWATSLVDAESNCELKNRSLRAMTILLARRGLFELAIQKTEAMSGMPELKSQALAFLCVKLAETGQFDRAGKFANQIEIEQIHSLALECIEKQRDMREKALEKGLISRMSIDN